MRSGWGDTSGLRFPYKKWVKTRAQLAKVEAENIRKATLKYMTGKLPCNITRSYVTPGVLQNGDGQDVLHRKTQE